jgi:hypothetical protein
MSMKRILAAALFALSLFATSALAQTPQVPLGPSGSGGSGGGSGGSGGVTVGAAITGTCPNGDVLFSNSGAIGCEVGSGTGTVTSVGWTGGIVSIANPTTVPAFTIAGTSGGIPYFASASTWASSAALAANALVVGGGAGAAPATVTTGSGVLTALGNAANAAGGFVTVGTTQPAPLTVGTGGAVTGSYGYYVCTTTCSITLPTPAAGVQFCVRNDSAVTTVITIAAITSVQFEKTTFNGYGAVTTGTMVSGGALGDKICLIGRDSTHYLVGTFVGTWTNS